MKLYLILFQMKYILRIPVVLLLILLINSCKKKEVPTLTTSEITNIAGTSATCGGTVTEEGSGPIVACGVCWSTGVNPTLNDSKTSDIFDAGAFTSTISGLSIFSTYYIRAYATNGAGTGYGNELTFATKEVIPTLTTSAIDSITTTSAVSGGNVTSDGGATVIARGVCWNTSPNPTFANFKTEDDPGTGLFECTITGLTAYTAYYVRAYATNSVGIAYGNERSFIASSEKPSIGDIYQGGIVAYILEPGDPGYITGEKHGLIAAEKDQSESIGWSNGIYIPTNATGTLLGTGKDNTNAIIASQGPGTYAASICKSLTLGGFNDWYLPSIAELNKLYINKDAIGGFETSSTDFQYWSSSENSYRFAWYQDFNFGFQAFYGKDYLNRVRAVRAF
jgi:hypothetical protein